MKANILSPLLLFAALLLPVCGSATAPLDGPNKKDFERKLSETFRTTNDDRVKLVNRYGQVNVQTWSRPEVKIDVLIRVAATNQEDADEVFERIDVDLSHYGGVVSAVTEIDNKSRRGSWWDLLTGNSSSSSDFKIYFTVNMPAGLDLTTQASYCDVNLPSLTGETTLDVRYGDLVAGRLSNRNEVSISYGSSRVEELGQNSRLTVRYSEGVVRNADNLRYNGRYSEMRIGRANTVTIDAGYEEVEIGEAEEVRLEGNYNELMVSKVARVYLDGNYCEFDLGTVTQSLEVDASYGDLEVDQLAAGFERVYVRARYLDVEIDVDEAAGYELDLQARYGDIDVDSDGLQDRKSHKEGQTRTLRGRRPGQGNGRMDISTSYGDIELY